MRRVQGRFWPGCMTEKQGLKPPVCLNTRPAHQGAQLAKALMQNGFKVLDFPTIQIVASPSTPFLETLARQLSNFDIVLFVSRNAVDYAFHYLNNITLAPDLQFGVIGKGSMQALQKHGVESQIIPAASFNSEGLLASASLQQVSAKRIIIFRGQEGRNLLGDTLRERGAQVTYCEVYRRELPQYPENTFARLTFEGFPDVVIFTSAEGLLNCHELLKPDEWQRLSTVTWLLISERMRETAHKLGHNAATIIAKTASDEGILQTLQEWHNTRQ